jgi:geranylgeranyl diphosphate synthase type I
VTEVPAVFSRYRERIDQEILRAIRGPDLPLYTMVYYQLGWVDATGAEVTADRGKAIRPTLCLLMCEALGGNIDGAIPSAAGLELLHNFSLIHDDVMDGDETRRHRPTVWSIWGQAQAIDAGDLLHVLAMLNVIGSDQDGEDAVLCRDSAEVMARGCRLVTEGQHLDLEFESRPRVTVDQYVGMIERKSAALISVAFEMAAIFSGNAPEVRKVCQTYGCLLGTAFQIRDDMLGIWGDPAVTGKPSGADIRKRKKTLPIIHAFEKATDQDRRRLTAIYSNDAETPDPAMVMAILDRAGSYGFTDEYMRTYVQKASASAAKLPISEWGRQNLEEVARYMAGRTN